MDKHALKAAGVHLLVAGLVEAGGSERNRDRHLLSDAVLPVELAAVVVIAASLNALESGRPRAHPSETVRKHLDIVVHEPNPGGAEIVGDAHSFAETARAARVRLEATVHELGADAIAKRLHNLGGVIAGRVVDDHDMSRLRVHARDALEKAGEQVRAIERDDRDRHGCRLEGVLFHACHTRPSHGHFSSSKLEAQASGEVRAGSAAR